MTRCLRVSRLALIAGLGLSLAAWTFPAGSHSLKRSCSDPCLKTNRVRNSQERTTQPQRVTPPAVVIVLAPEVRPGGLLERFPQGSRLARLDHSEAAPQCLTSGFFAAADPRISFDGARVLFAGKKTAASPWQIWEMSVDGSGARQLTECSGGCVKPAYLPRGEIVYTAFGRETAGKTESSVGAKNDVRVSASVAGPNVGSQIWVSKLDGSNAHPITFGPGDFQVETVLRNGTILATARSPLVPSHGLPADRELYTLRPDGSGLATFRCDHQHPAIRGQASELEDGAVVFVKAPLGSRKLGGELAWIRQGALHNAPLTSAPTVVLSPQAASTDGVLVARESPSRTGTPEKLAVYAFDAAAGRFIRPIYKDRELSAVEAVPVAAHEPPRWYRSTLDPDLHRGYFICLNAYLAEGMPQGRIAATLARVRVLALDAATQKESLLGEAPIEADGSFYIAVPPDQPIRFEVLDAAGRVVRSQRSWIWSRSGDEHGCVGCHEDRNLAPENRWPLALRKMDNPVHLETGKHKSIQASHP